MARIDELRLITRVAQMYHLEGRRQSEIAELLHISQATVSRMLKRAEAEGIVRTTVVGPPGTFGALEEALRQRFGLTEAIVVDARENREAEIMARIGEAAAHVVEVTLQPGEVIGVSSWSETILRMVEGLHPRRGPGAAFVVQTLGGMGDPAVEGHATQLTTRLAHLTGAEPRLLTTPGVAGSAEGRAALLADPYVQDTMGFFDRLSLAVVGIGAMEPSRMLARSGNVFSEAELAELAAAGAVGDIGLRFFDKAGAPVVTALDGRVIGIGLDQLARTARVLALAGGPDKTAAISAALATGVIDVLVTDRFTAAALADPEAPPATPPATPLA